MKYAIQGRKLERLRVELDGPKVALRAPRVKAALLVGSRA